MRICIKCKKELRCIKTGIKVVYGIDHVYAGDAFECPDCGAQVAVCRDTPYHDPDVLVRSGSTIVKMD